MVEVYFNCESISIFVRKKFKVLLSQNLFFACYKFSNSHNFGFIHDIAVEFVSLADY